VTGDVAHNRDIKKRKFLLGEDILQDAAEYPCATGECDQAQCKRKAECRLGAESADQKLDLVAKTFFDQYQRRVIASGSRVRSRSFADNVLKTTMRTPLIGCNGCVDSQPGTGSIMFTNEERGGRPECDHMNAAACFTRSAIFSAYYPVPPNKNEVGAADATANYKCKLPPLRTISSLRMCNHRQIMMSSD
jgi:hypothetical protein